MEIIFFTSIAILIYTYIGYGVLTKLITLFLPKQKLPELQDEDYPQLTHIIAAFNEESIIADKISNCAFLDYPKDKVRTIIVTDGSNDNTASIVRNDPRVEHFHQSQRNGKLAAVNRVIEAIQTDIIVFSDANTELNESALKNLTKHFQNNRVGAVAGEKKVISSQNDDASASGEGIYWKYESWLKKIDYKLHSVVGAAGELFAVRYHLYEAPDSNLLIEDFITSMRIAQEGYRIAYAPDAVASEHSSASIAEESKRKIRISAGGLQAVYHLREMLNPFKYGVLTFQYFSHRVLRWTAAPLAIMFGGAVKFLPLFYVCSSLLLPTSICWICLANEKNKIENCICPILFFIYEP
jgi:biofilm PGA synthesis N-glycosyltransferase PgaC